MHIYIYYMKYLLEYSWLLLSSRMRASLKTTPNNTQEQAPTLKCLLFPFLPSWLLQGAMAHFGGSQWQPGKEQNIKLELQLLLKAYCLYIIIKSQNLYVKLLLLKDCLSSCSGSWVFHLPKTSLLPVSCFSNYIDIH